MIKILFKRRMHGTDQVAPPKMSFNILKILKCIKIYKREGSNLYLKKLTLRSS